MKNKIGVDTSLSSTGMYISTPSGEHYFNYRNNDKHTKWHKLLDFVKYRDYYAKDTIQNNYSSTEVEKLCKYNYITDIIVNDIQEHCKPEETEIFTEGYSYSSTGDIIDLVTYGAILRNKLITKGFCLNIIAPTSLKMNTCKYTYSSSKNNNGISGGRFKKTRNVIGSI